MPSPNNQNSSWPWLVLVALLALFIWGLQQVARAPLASGEAYPPYSSLRADPLGTKALHDSLQALPELSVARQYRNSAELPKQSALLQLGVNATPWRRMSKQAILADEKRLAAGGRLIIAFLPENPQKVFENEELDADAPDAKPRRPKDDTKNDTQADDDAASYDPANSVGSRWNVKLAFRERGEKEKVPDGLPKQTALSLSLGPEWQVLGTINDLPVVAERPLGGGSVVLVTDSYPLSNEGLRDGRDVALLAGILGGAQRIYFDENQLGVSETGSVAGLIRKYHMQSAVGVLLVAAFLFIWRSSSSFLPATAAPNEIITGRQTQDGMASLLRSTASEDQLVPLCYDEWLRSAAKDSVRNAKAGLVKKQLEGAGKDPVAAYRAACAVITREKVTKTR